MPTLGRLRGAHWQAPGPHERDYLKRQGGGQLRYQMSTSGLHTQELTCTCTHTHKGGDKDIYSPLKEPKGLGFTELLTKDSGLLVC